MTTCIQLNCPKCNSNQLIDFHTFESMMFHGEKPLCTHCSTFMSVVPKDLNNGMVVTYDSK